MAKKNSGAGTVKSIDTLLFDETINAMKNAVSAFSAARKNVNTATDRLLGTWEGKGKDSFNKVYKKLKTELKDEEDNLTTVKEDLIGIKDTYVDWDTGLKNEFGKKE